MTRRDFLRYAGYSAAALALLSQLDAVGYKTIQAGRRMFPKTYQSAYINGDGQYELLARNGQTILANLFDTTSGQWLPLPNGPAWSDSSSFIQPLVTPRYSPPTLTGTDRRNYWAGTARKFRCGNTMPPL